MPTVKDLSTVHALISDLFKQPTSEASWQQFALKQEQIDFFNTNGYIGGIKLLDDWQVERLRKELEEVAEPKNPSSHLFYEFHSNESSNPETILFHALGAWRISNGFHDVLWYPRFLVHHHQLLCNVPLKIFHDPLF